jgi:hypothetical protein
LAAATTLSSATPIDCDALDSTLGEMVRRADLRYGSDSDSQLEPILPS